jgi:hypothetical protein
VRKPHPIIGRKLYFKELRGDKEKYYIGTFLGFRHMVRTTRGIFGGQIEQWTDDSLLIETSDHRRVQAWQLDTFEVNPNE